MVEQTYVHDGVEVKKTGRTATRSLGIPGRGETKSTLVEIAPVDDDLSWKKWVDPKALFVVEASKKAT
jgi:hypothetical protein